MTQREPEFLEFPGATAMYAALASEIAKRISAAVDARSHASLVVSGGTTPGELFDLLSKHPLPWTSVTITLSDERWVEPGSVRSNEHLARTRLLVDRARGAHFVPLKTAAAHAADGAAECAARVAGIPRPFDVMLLGMGDDGHTASLIPNSGGLDEALAADAPPVAAISPPLATGMGERMTLTLRTILNSRQILLLIRGQGKRDAYERALAGDDIRAQPVRAVLRQSQAPVSVYWSP